MASEVEIEYLREIIDTLKMDINTNINTLKEDITKVLNKHNDTIYGNGVPGLTTRIRILEVAGAGMVLVLGAWLGGVFGG